MALTGLEIADRLAGHGIGVTVVDPRWTKPVDEALVGAGAAAPAGGHRRGQRAGRRVRRRGGPAAARPRRGHAGQDVRPAAGVPLARHPRRGARRGGPDAAAPGQADHRGGGAPVTRSMSARRRSRPAGVAAGRVA